MAAAILLVMPFPPGGTVDPIFRPLVEAAAHDLGKPIVLMPRPGSGGITGTASLAVMNEADGYTIAVMHNSVIRAPLVQKVTWDPLRDLTYLASLFGLTTGVTVAVDAPWKSLAELLGAMSALPVSTASMASAWPSWRAPGSTWSRSRAVPKAFRR